MEKDYFNRLIPGTSYGDWIVDEDHLWVRKVASTELDLSISGCFTIKDSQELSTKIYARSLRQAMVIDAFIAAMGGL